MGIEWALLSLPVHLPHPTLVRAGIGQPWEPGQEALRDDFYLQLQGTSTDKVITELVNYPGSQIIWLRCHPPSDVTTEL